MCFGFCKETRKSNFRHATHFCKFTYLLIPAKLTDDVFIVDKPSFQQLPPLAEDAQGIQGRQLIPFIESLVDIIPTCKVRDLGKQKQGLAENGKV